MTPEHLSTVIGTIYDCALEPQRWPDALRHLVDVTSSAASVLGIHDHKAADSTYQHGYDPAHLELYNRTYAALNPLIPALMLAPVGEVLAQSSLCDETEFLESRFYNEWCKPARMREGIFVKPLHSSTIVVLAVNRREGQSSFGEAERRCLRLLVPHITKSLTISDAFDLRSIAAGTLAVTLDGLSTAVFLTGTDGRLVHANRAGELMLAAGAALRLVGQRLVAVDSTAQTALAASLASGSHLNAADGADTRTTSSIALPVEMGPGCVATVLPLDQGERMSLLSPFAASAAVFVQTPTAAPPFPGQAFASLYGLTGGELRVLLALSQGFDPAAAAEFLGVKEATVRTHLLRIFDKTGTHRQPELVALLMASTPPVGNFSRSNG